MFASQIIENGIISLRASDTAALAIDLLTSQNILELPVIDDGKLIFWVNINQLKLEKKDLLLINLPKKNQNEKISVNLNQHLLVCLPIFAKYETTMLAVENDNNLFVGIINIEKILNFLYPNKSVEHSAIVVLNMEPYQYSLSKISGIVEYNNQRVLLSLTTDNLDNTIDVHLLLNTNQLQSILQSFNRYNYTVKFVDNQQDKEGADNERFQLFMKYLDL